MSRYAMRNPENPHGDPNGYFPQPHTEAEDGGRSYFVPDGAIDPNSIVSAPGKVISKYAGLTPDQVLEKMAADNAQNQRFVTHGPAMLEIIKEDATLPCHRMGNISCKMHPDPDYPWCQSCRARAVLAKVEGKETP